MFCSLLELGCTVTDTTSPFRSVREKKEQTNIQRHNKTETICYCLKPLVIAKCLKILANVDDTLANPNVY
jgi:hypothetical protein